MALNPSPQRQQVLNFVTPDVGDILFFETVDAQRLGENNVPEYGTPHPDYKRWPNHKLVLITPSDSGADAQGRYFRYFYAAKRESQDEYNFEFGSTQIGGLIVDSITRTYVTLRSEFDPSAADATIGAAMPNVPVDKFTGTWILYDVDQKRIGQQELDSLFVAEQRIYIQSTTGQGATYGEIVTTSDSTVAVVDEGTNVDTGINIISSQITPLGNGKAVKQTREVLGGWPDPVEQSFSTPAEGLPPAIVRDNLEVTTVTRKIEDIPASITLTGNEIGKTYKRETPDRVEEEVTTADFDITTDLLEHSVNRTAYLVTTTESTASDTEELPIEGDGSSNLIYRAGDLKVYKNTTVTTEGVAGLKGVDTLAQTWGSIVETTNYTLTPDVIAGGSTRLIFKDSMTEVYESSAVDVSVSGTTAEKDPQAWGHLLWNGTYSTAPSGERYSQVWSNGVTNVYKNENSTVNITGTTTEIDPQVWGSLIWNGSYDTTSDGTRSNQVWSNGIVNVYRNEEPTPEVNGDEYLSGHKSTPLLTVSEYTSYGLAPSPAGVNNSSKVIFSINDIRVYENVRQEIEPTEERTYGAVINFSFPSVLLSIDAIVYPRRDGTNEIHYEPVIREGYQGAVPCTVTEYYTTTPPAVPPVTTFKPEVVSFSTPFGSVRIPATLHGDLSFPVSTGTVDPIYEYVTQNISIPATTPTDYVGIKFVANYDITPYEDGYIVRTYEIEVE